MSLLNDVPLTLVCDDLQKLMKELNKCMSILDITVGTQH